MKKINIKEEALKIVNQINEKNPYYLVIGVLLLLLVFDYLLVMQFQLNAMQKLSPRIIQIEGDFKQFETNRLRIDKYQEQIVELEEQLETLEKRIKTTEEIPMVLEELTRIGSRHKFFVEQILPDTNFGEPILKNSKGSYYLLPIMVEARSGYHSFGNFLNNLETTGSLMKLDQMMIVSSEKNPRQHAIRLNLQAVIFEPVQRAQR